MATIAVHLLLHVGHHLLCIHLLHPEYLVWAVGHHTRIHRVVHRRLAPTNDFSNSVEQHHYNSELSLHNKVVLCYDFGDLCDCGHTYTPSNFAIGHISYVAQNKYIGKYMKTYK